ncbi:hypothetical protein HF264_14530 [Rhizobium leguminosarum]|uniref:hypothetical protein n=1 Tax=Rhizobium leguminosarum TaxID=384 RepID=UPI001C9087C5|nr:hypothetical protein [Rhizobium leguminosarum]MBY2940918.1 hypothetical protein [Rhizobium leguminosarum]
MSMKLQTTYKAPLELLFVAIDEAPTSGEKPYFKSFADKEWYETQIMFAVRKMQAAEYHLANVKKHLALDRKEARQASKKHDVKPESSAQTIETKASLTRSRTEYVQELSAFLFAIRSGIDFICVAAARSIAGFNEVHSVKSFLGPINNGKTGPILDVVRYHLEWIKELRAYRDELVHRVVAAAPSSGWVVSHRGLTAFADIPVVVPKGIPKRVPDTRRSRMMADEMPPLGLTQSETYGSVTYENGKEEPLEHSVSFLPSKGYQRIEKFMERHHKEFDAFLRDVFVTLVDLNFQPPGKLMKVTAKSADSAED